LNVSASVVVYDTPLSTLRKCVDSFLRSRVKALYLVDNSMEGIGEAFRGYRKVIYIKTHKNIGFGAANNLALKEALAKGFKYHIVANPDIYFGSEVVDSLYSFMEVNPDIGAVMPRVLFPNGKEQNLRRDLPTPLNLIRRRLFSQFSSNGNGKPCTRVVDVPFLSGCFMFIRTSVLKKVDLFDERFFLYMEDVDLSRRIGEVSRTVFYPYVHIYHEWQRYSYKDLKHLLIHIESAIKYFAKWGMFNTSTGFRSSQSRENLFDYSSK